MSAASIRTVLPLAVLTGSSMLAMDLFLPAVPALQQALGIGIDQAQATVAIFLGGLAASQLLWGELLNRIGPRRCVQAGVGLLLLASVGCALAPDITWLLAMRLLQGIAAGAATVVAPSVVRASLADVDAVRGMATIASIEAIVPAAGPVLGTALLAWTDWRGTFWVLAAAFLAVLPFVVRIAPARLPGLDRRVPARYVDILGNRRYLRLALSHALCIGALISFVASAPQLLPRVFLLGPSAFAVLQVFGVGAFMLAASQSGRVSQRLQPLRAVRWGAAAHVLLCAALLVAALMHAVSFAGLVVFWCTYCAVVALRGPAAFSLALQLPPAQMGRASALMVLALLAVSAIATQAIAPFVGGASLVPVATMLLLASIASAALVPRSDPP
jgi:DHA1 family bicyclomycin/chloramphenicol resistance-like MFS transporter